MVDLIIVPRATIQLLYGQKNISRDIAPYFLELTYTDHLNGESDELDVTLENSDQRWINDWYPAKGDTLTASIIFGGDTLSCGTFEIDELGASICDGTLTLHALATGQNSPLRTRQSKAFEATTLQSIAAQFARKHNLSLVGQIRDVPIDRASQYHETDLHFLKRIGREYGYLFSIKKGQLLFSELAELRNLKPSFFITPDMVSADHLTDKIKGVYSGVEQSRHDPVKRRLTHYSKRSALADDPNSTSSDTIRHHRRAHTSGAAQVQSQAELDHANLEKTTGSLTFTEGNIHARSGVAFGLQKWGVFTGTYQIDTATHTVGRSGGYGTSVEAKRTDQLPVLSKPQKSGKKAAKKSSTAKSHVQVLTGKSS